MRKVLYTILLIASFGVLAQAPIAYYPFNGNANDESANSNDGTVNGATLTADRFGNANSAYSFDGIDDQITANLTVPSTSGTFTAWVNYKDADVSGWHTILEFDNDFPFFGIFEGRLLLLGAVDDVDGLVAKDQWVFVAATYTASAAAELYINGVSVESSVSVSGLSLSGTAMGIGYNGSDTPFEGDIDDVRIYDRALSAQEISDLYQENALITTWQTTTASESITIPTTGIGYDYMVDWGDGTVETGFTGDATHTYTNAGTYTVAIQGNFPRIYFNDFQTIAANPKKIKSIEQWGDISWTTMASAFSGCTELRVYASDSPNLANVTDISRMFQQNTVMNDPIGNWNVSNVNSMVATFENASAFNQDLGNWDVSNVTSMPNMFRLASVFNMNIEQWDVGKVVNAAAMFENATSFDKNLGSWDFSSVSNLTVMLNNCGMSTANYDATLAGWSTLDAGETQIPSSVTLGATGLNYCLGLTARNTLINTHSWTISGDTQDCSGPGLVAYYTLDGDATDQSGNGNDGILGDGVTNSTFPTLTTDRFGNANSAYSFDGVNDFIDLGISTSGSFQNKTSMVAWIKAGAQGSGTIVSRGLGFRIEKRVGDVINFGTFGLTNDIMESTTVFDDNTWHFVVGTYDGSTKSLYVDGNLEAQLIGVTGTAGQANLNTLIGNQAAADDYFTGEIDDLRIYNRALSSTEIANIYASESGLLAHYTFSGDATDASGNGNDGTVNGASLTTDRFGNANSAYSFDGTSSFITLPTPSEIINTSINQFSFVTWINSVAGDGTTKQNIFEATTTSTGQNNEVFFEAPMPGPLLFEIDDNNNNIRSVTSQSLNLNTWYQVVGTYDGAEQKIYINGQLDDTQAWVDNFTINSTIFIGRDDDSGVGQYFNGKIDDIRIYNRALSVTEISDLYTSESGPIAYYPFSGNANDVSGNGYHGTVTGATLATDRFGNANSAYSFDGTDLISTTFQPIDNGPFTISVWANWPGTSTGITFQELVGWEGAATSQTYLGFAEADGNIRFGDAFATTNAFLSANVWTQVVAVFDGSNAYIYLNGQEAASLATTGTFNFSTMAFGSLNTSGNEFFIGSLDDIRFYDKPLSATEVADLYTIESGPLVYYPFSGNANDLSGNNIQGSLPNGGTYATDRFGNISGALDLDGSTQYVSADNGNQPIMSGNAVTFAGWFKASQYQANSFVLNTPGLIAFFDENGFPNFAPQDDALSNILEYGTAIPLNEWVHFVGTYDGSFTRIYIDGIEVASEQIDKIMNRSSFGTQVGGNGSTNFPGTIDDIRIYDNALSASQVLDLYNSEKIIGNETDVTSFSFTEQTDPATINATNKTVAIEVNVSDVAALVATYTLSTGATASIGSTAQVSGTTANSFTTAVTYTITAQDGTTTQDWVVTVTIASTTATDITAFSFTEQTGPATINATNKTVAIEVNSSTTLSALVATFTLSTGATAAIGGTAQVSATTANDFTNPVTYTITAQDGSTTQDWVVTVTIESTTANDITTFSFNEESGAATIDPTNKTVDIEVTSGTDVTALVATYTLSTGATAAIGGTTQVSATTANDFTNPVTYTITAQDGSTTQDWVVTVTIQDTSSPTAFSNLITPTQHTIGDGNFTIGATIVDSDGINTVEINRKKVSESSYTTEIMTNTAGSNDYTFSMAETNLDKTGVQYYFEVLDDLSNVARSSTFITYALVADNSEVLPSIAAGTTIQDYNIIAFPYQSLNTADLTDDLGTYNTENWRLLRYSSGVYQDLNQFNSISPGVGYWFIFKDESVTVNVGGQSTEVDENGIFRINLSSGYNLIGNPFKGTLSWGDVVQYNLDNAIIQSGDINSGNTSTLDGWTTTWVDRSSLNSFEGAFVNMVNAVTNFEIPISALNGSGGRTAVLERKPQNAYIEDAEWELRFFFSTPSYSYSMGGIGMHPEALDEDDRFDKDLLPKFFLYLDLEFADGNTRSFKQSDYYKVWDFTVPNNLEEKTFNLTWDVPVSTEKTIILVDGASNKIYDLKETRQIALPNDPSATHQLYYGDKETIFNNIDLPFDALYSIYPNPVENELTLQMYAIEDKIVTIDLISINGKTIPLGHLQLSKGLTTRKISFVENAISDGIYFIKVDDKILTKILKK